MKIASETTPNSRVVLNIEVDQDTVDRGLHRAYQRFANRLRIPGFRPGKAPRAVVERHVGRAALMQEAVDLLLPDVFRRAVEETGIKPVAQPHFDLVQLEPLTLKATVDVEPTVALGDYRSVRVERPTVEVSEADVDAAVADLRQKHATYAPVERPVEVGDVAMIDARLAAGERSLFDRRDVEYRVDPAVEQPLPGFAVQLVGMSAGASREFDLDVPADDERSDLAGQTVRCAVTVREVKEVQLPPLEDGLAALHGDGELTTLAELRDHLAQSIRAQREREAAEQYEETAVARAVEQARVEVPESLVERDVDRMLERLAARFSGQPLARQQFAQTLQQRGEELRAQLRPDAERTLTTELVLDSVATAEGLEVTADEIAAEIERMAQSADEQGDQIREVASRPSAQESIGRALRRRKARQRLVEIAGGAPALAATMLVAAEATGEGRE
ncbi:MAG: trigger factor [Chloroflexi bacterium]|nr:trigger factor [Chloroflexota bacterium]